MSNIYYLGAKKSCSLLENGVSFTKKEEGKCAVCYLSSWREVFCLDYYGRVEDYEVVSLSIKIHFTADLEFLFHLMEFPMRK